MDVKYEAEANEKARELAHDEFDLAEGNNQLERGLQSRHIQFLALGMDDCAPSDAPSY